MMSRKRKEFFETQGLVEDNIPNSVKNTEEFDDYEGPFPESAVKCF